MKQAAAISGLPHNRRAAQDERSCISRCGCLLAVIGPRVLSMSVAPEVVVVVVSACTHGSGHRAKNGVSWCAMAKTDSVLASGFLEVRAVVFMMIPIALVARSLQSTG